MKRKEALTNFLSEIKLPKITLTAPVSAFMLVILMSSSLCAQQPAQRPEQPTGTAKEGVVPLINRIGHTDPAKAMPGKNVHQGTGTLGMQTLLGRGSVKNLAFMHHGPLGPKSSIGHHFHTNSDEMFLILDGDCEFTVNGKTALIKGPVGVPCKSGSSHAVYNPSARPVDWINFNVAINDPSQQTATLPAQSQGGGFPRRGTYNYSADPTSLFETA